jgi:signal transduction histidine kinase
MVTEFENDGVKGSMLQFIDVTVEVMFDQQKQESKHLAIANAQVSHELRNPLHSIIAHNLERKQLF